MKGAFKLFRCVWRDGVLVPEPRFARWCHEQFGEGEVIQLERHEDRSTESHNHYFASIKTCWDNLPDKEVEERFPTPEALRKWALIRNGYCTESSVVCDSNEQANVIAAFMGKREGEVIVVRDNVIKKYVAMSQSYRAMDKDEFQKSKTLVLDTLAELIAVTRKRLEQAARSNT